MQSKLTIRHAKYDDYLHRRNSETFNCDPEKINVYMSSDTAIAVDTWIRDFVALSKDDYFGEAFITQTQNIYEMIDQRCL